MTAPTSSFTNFTSEKLGVADTEVDACAVDACVLSCTPARRLHEERAAAEIMDDVAGVKSEIGSKRKGA
jgi:hypothetical protein